jgi:hypothetical protein
MKLRNSSPYSQLGKQAMFLRLITSGSLLELESAIFPSCIIISLPYMNVMEIEVAYSTPPTAMDLLFILAWSIYLLGNR